MMGKVNPDGGHPASSKMTIRTRTRCEIQGHRALELAKGPARAEIARRLRWSPMADAPVITDGAFDSQNLAFWDAQAGLYRAYWRYFTGG
jgi:hypothetical protein